jgi:excisionase family DNA binding protein
MTKSDDSMTTKQVATLLSISERTVRRWRETKSEDLPYFRLKGVIRYHRSDVKAFLKKFSIGSSF